MLMIQDGEEATASRQLPVGPITKHIVHWPGIRYFMSLSTSVLKIPVFVVTLVMFRA
jgi:hypothetical protein